MLSKCYCATNCRAPLPLIKMATTPEEFFVKDLMEQPPASPPVFHDLVQNPNGSSEGQHHVPNTMVLPYISRMLMEDHDGDNKLTDHPELLQVQLPFAHILRSLSFDANTDNMEEPGDSLHEVHGDQSVFNFPLSKGKYVLGASLECMEEANMFLPKDNNLLRVEQVNQIRESKVSGSRIKKRYNRDHLLEEEVRCSSKAMMMINEPEEKCCGDEMLDEMMLHAYETCIVKGMERVTMDNNGAAKRNKKSGRIKSARNNMVDIGTLLICCGQAVADGQHMTAHELLTQIKQHASATGDATQRLAHCFTKGLEARIGGKGSQVWQLLMLEQQPSLVEFLKAYNLFSKSCCFLNVTFIFTTMTIVQAMVGKSRLHIVDYGLHCGFLWAGLLRLLASKEGSSPEVRLTAITRPKTAQYPGELNAKIGCRLMKCAHEFGLPFKFHTITRNWEDVSIMDLNTDVNEVLVVIDLFSFSVLKEESIFFDSPSPRDTVLSNVKKMRPDVFIRCITNRSYGSCFLSRFREMLSFYMPMFEMLDATIPRESKSRSVLEQGFLGHYFFNDISCEGMDLVERPEKYKQWQTRNQRAGLRQLPLKSSIVKAVEDEVKNHFHKDFMICQDGQWLLYGWMGRVLSAYTQWVAEDASS